MRSALRLVAFTVVVFALTGCARRVGPPGRVVEPANPVNYYIRLTSPGAARYEVTLATERVPGDSVDFVLPAWLPGLYATRTPSVPENFAARDGRGRPLPVRRLAVNAWRLYTETTDYVSIDYKVVPGSPAEPLATRPQIDLHGGYAVGATLLGYLEGLEMRPVTLTFDLPPGWRAATPLRPAGPNRFAGPNYFDFVTAPFVIGGRWRDYKLFVQGKPHQVVVQGAGAEFAPDTLLRLINETIELGTSFYGRSPYERYLFAIHFVTPDASGMGAIGQPTGSAFFLPPLAGNRMRDAGLGAILLHQYLHAWFPGQFGPTSILRPELRFPPRVPDAWLVEGAAEYYARLLPVRNGASERTTFYDSMADVLWYWRELGGGDRIDLLDLSTAARSGEPRETSRLVAGGTLAAFLLDLMIREETRGVRGLDHLTYFLQRRGSGYGYDESQIWTDATTALELPPAALSVLATRGRLSIEANLERAGLRAVQREVRHRALGAVLAPDAQGRFLVTSVERGGTAAAAGMREGDVLLEINGTPVSPNEVIATRFALSTFIEGADSGARVTFEVERNDRAVELTGTVRSVPATRITIVERSGVSEMQRMVRASLFQSGAALSGASDR
jgi:predicted metalloprotease with PDZ domain